VNTVTSVFRCFVIIVETCFTEVYMELISYAKGCVDHVPLLTAAAVNIIAKVAAADCRLFMLL